MRYLGLDVGDQRIGVALSDPEGWLAQPLTVLQRASTEKALQAIAQLVKQHEVEQVVVGLPLSLRGTVGPQAAKVQAFARRLGERLGLEAVLWDERLSTVAAQRAMAGVKAQRRREKIDAVAAALILQNYLDYLSVAKARAGGS